MQIQQPSRSAEVMAEGNRSLLHFAVAAHLAARACSPRRVGDLMNAAPARIRVGDDSSELLAQARPMASTRIAQQPLAGCCLVATYRPPTGLPSRRLSMKFKIVCSSSGAAPSSGLSCWTTE